MDAEVFQRNPSAECATQTERKVVQPKKPRGQFDRKEYMREYMRRRREVNEKYISDQKRAMLKRNLDNKSVPQIGTIHKYKLTPEEVEELINNLRNGVLNS